MAGQTVAELIRAAWFDGPDYVPARDDKRLRTQSMRIYMLMRKGAWWTLCEIAAQTGEPEASISARLRDYRKERFGGLDVQRRHRVGAQREYRIKPRQPDTQRDMFAGCR